ncbi:glutathione S-transferase family protein [Shewanella salipaludis]|uniref:glutathione transferase n=1 Tax=Shewanella salipaludis TaxID=2723052 RepID=A0A972G4P1_9GAMM|nr:glutathione S-transferase [Shewanella salipaludis]NMH67169.1 glutathione S-transferase [Shewanella salipaludis]
MITLHHLNKSRSQRIIWLLEELGQVYEIKSYQRDSQTFLAPPELQQIHPLGKSPVIEIEGRVIAESGAITEYLIARYAADTLAPAPDSGDHVSYLQWIHFAESSAILPLLLQMFVQKDGCKTHFLEGYAAMEIAKVMGYLNEMLAGKTYLVGERLSGADIMMSFIVEILANQGELDKFSHIQAYAERLRQHAGFIRASRLEAELDNSL